MIRTTNLFQLIILTCFLSCMNRSIRDSKKNLFPEVRSAQSTESQDSPTETSYEIDEFIFAGTAYPLVKVKSEDHDYIWYEACLNTEKSRTKAPKCTTGKSSENEFWIPGLTPGSITFRVGACTDAKPSLGSSPECIFSTQKTYTQQPPQNLKLHTDLGKLTRNSQHVITLGEHLYSVVRSYIENVRYCPDFEKIIPSNKISTLTSFGPYLIGVSLLSDENKLSVDKDGKVSLATVVQKLKQPGDSEEDAHNAKESDAKNSTGKGLSIFSAILIAGVSITAARFLTKHIRGGIETIQEDIELDPKTQKPKANATPKVMKKKSVPVAPGVGVISNSKWKRAAAAGALIGIVGVLAHTLPETGASAITEVFAGIGLSDETSFKDPRCEATYLDVKKIISIEDEAKKYRKSIEQLTRKVNAH